MKSEDKFQELLKLGTEAEEIVYSYLIRNNTYVQDMRKQTHEDFKGPRLIGTEGELVLPDFSTYNKDPKKSNCAIDVKYKNSIYPIKGRTGLFLRLTKNLKIIKE